MHDWLNECLWMYVALIQLNDTVTVAYYFDTKYALKYSRRKTSNNICHISHPLRQKPSRIGTMPKLIYRPSSWWVHTLTQILATLTGPFKGTPIFKKQKHKGCFLYKCVCMYVCMNAFANSITCNLWIFFNYISQIH